MRDKTVARRCLRTILATGALALAIASASAQTPKKQAKPAPAAKQEYSETDPLPVDVVGGIELKQSPAGEASEGAREQREKYDLVAQQRTANAAVAQAVLSFLSFIGLIFAVVFAFQTYKQAKRSADAAFDAVQRAERSAKAAEDAVAITGDTAARQLRAYLSATPFHMALNAQMDQSFPAPITVAFHVLTKNHGATPAQDALVWANIMFEDWPQPDGFWNNYPETLSQRCVINPGEEKTFSFSKNLMFDPNGINAVPEKRLIVFGVVRYIDVFGKPHFTRFNASTANLKDWWSRARQVDTPQIVVAHTEGGGEAD